MLERITIEFFNIFHNRTASWTLDFITKLFNTFQLQGHESRQMHWIQQNIGINTPCSNETI